MDSNRCKIMFFVYMLGQGGAERVILNILNHIDLEKYEVHLTMGVQEGNDYLPFLNRKDKIQIHYLDVPLGQNEQASTKLAAYIDQFAIDILFTEAYFTNTLAYHAKRKAKRKVKLIFREATSRSKTAFYNWKDVIKTFIRYNFYARKVIAISDGVKNDLHKSYFVFNRKLVRIYNPIDIEFIKKQALQKITNQTFLSIKGKKIITVARLAPAKDQKVLLRAFQMLKESYPHKVSLILVGKGELEAELKAFCQEHQITNVYFLGFQENPYPFVKASDVFVLSSKSEGFGNVLTEAMALETPVVSTDCMSGPREILKNGRCGLLVEVGNSKQLAEALEKVLTDDDVRKKIVNNAKKELPHYQIKNIVKQYEAVIDTVYKK